MATVTSRAVRLRAALFGLVFHAVAIAATMATASAKGLVPPAGFYPVAIPAALLASVLVYATLVASYLARRKGGRGAVFYDSAVGMLAEVLVVAVSAVFLASVMAAVGPATGLVDTLRTAAVNTILFQLWAFAGFTIQILTIGNAAGLVGWLVLEKLLGRRGRGAVTG